MIRASGDELKELDRINRNQLMTSDSRSSAQSAGELLLKADSEGL